MGKSPLKSHPFHPVLVWDEDAEVTDLAYDPSKQFVYLLDTKNCRIYEWDSAREALLLPSPQHLTSLRFWTVSEFPMNSASRIAIFESNSGISIAIISGTEPDCLFLQPIQENEEGKQLRLRGRSSISDTSQTQPWAIAVDKYRHSVLLVGEHGWEIFECSLSSGELTLLKGTKKLKSIASPRANRLKTQENKLKDILVMNYRDYLEPRMFTDTSALVFDAARREGKDRCILFTNSTENCVYKLVEFGDIQCVLPLIGNGSEAPKNPLHIQPAPNLLKVPITAPSRLALSHTGGLAISSASMPAVAILWPVSKTFIMSNHPATRSS
jgi:hypothetical protein